MSFTENDYLSWYLPKVLGHDDAINLHASGVPSLTAADIGISTDFDPWIAGTELERGLGRWLGVPAESLLYTQGATGGSLLALLSLTGHGDELLIELPMYEPMVRQGARLAAAVHRFHRRRQDSWQLPLAEIERLLSSRTSMVMITEPSNPSGTFARREDVLALADLAAAQGALLLVNEVYLGFSDRPTFFGERDNILVTSSLSKLLGAYWLRIGWLAADPALIAKLRLAHLNLSMGNFAAAALGLGVIARADEWRTRARKSAAAGCAVVDDWVRATPGLEWARPEGPGFGCVALPDGMPDVTFVERLHQEHGVLLVPGSHFEVPGTMRLSWLQVGDQLDEGLQRIAQAL